MHQGHWNRYGSFFQVKSFFSKGQTVRGVKAWSLMAGAGVLAVSLAWGLISSRLSDHSHPQVDPSAEDPTVAPRPFQVSVPPPADRDSTLEPPEENPIRFLDVTQESGITFLHQDGSSGRHFTPETMSAGVATFDFDGDGLIDIYFPNGAALPGIQYDPPPRHALYRNLGDMRFQEVSLQAGIDCTAFGLGIAIADYDNDGFPDIYLNNFGPNILYRNNGDGTFSEITHAAGVEGTTISGDLEKKVGAGASFLDLTGSGQLDLFSGNYIEIDLENYVTPMKGHLPFYPSPMAYDPVPNTLYRNRGDGTFEDISDRSGISEFAGRCMGVISSDFDRDGHPDIFVCNDVFQNFLLRNDGQGRFTEVGLVAGVAMSPSAEMVANMAVDAGDYDNDGWLDFFTTNYEQQYPLLLRNLGDGNFSNETMSAHAGRSVFNLVNWGCGFADFDNDTHLDIFIGNGHTDSNVDFLEQGGQYRCHNVLLWNTGQQRFVDLSQSSGLRDVPLRAARGIAFDDLTNDGDVDVVILNSREPPTVLRNLLNESGSPHHWLQIRLVGVRSNRDGVGARVQVTAGELSLVREVHSGRGYQSHWGSRLHFGLGPHDHVDQIEIRWPTGGVQVLKDVSVDRLLTVVEDQHPGSGDDRGKGRP